MPSKNQRECEAEFCSSVWEGVSRGGCCLCLRDHKPPLEVLWAHSRGKPQDAENSRRGFNSSLLLLEDLVIPEGENEDFLGRRY